MENIIAFFSKILEFLNLTWETSGTLIILYLLGILWALVAGFRKLIIYFIRKFDEFNLNRNLHPYFSKKEVKKATKSYIETRCQNIPPSNFNELKETHAFTTSEKLIPFFMKRAFSTKNKNDQRFYLILADSGMGKTTFMINLYLSYLKKNWLKKRKKIKLFPLGHFNSLREIEQISDNEKDNTILLLDAFDEDNIAVDNYQERLSEILEIAWRFKAVIVTCRTQFFPSQIEEPNSTGLLKLGGNKGEHLFHKLYLTPFSNSDVKKYIKSQFNLLQFRKRRKAFRVIKKCPNLMVRPMLLNYIKDIIAPEVKIKSYSINFKLVPDTNAFDLNAILFDKIRDYKIFNFEYRFVLKSKDHRIKYKFSQVYQVYKVLIQKWIEREGNRQSSKREEFMNELYLFSREIALNMYEMRNIRGGFFIHIDEINEFAIKHNIILEKLEMTSRALLNRNTEGVYKFSHKSILEYFLAREALENKEFRVNLDKKGLDFLVMLLEEQLEKGWLFNNKSKILGRCWTSSFDPELVRNESKDLSTITNNDIQNLTYLNIENTYIPSVNFLSNSLKIKKLILRKNQLRICEPIEDLIKLEYLDLSKNELTECDFVRNLTKLKTLILSYNKINSIEPIGELVNLERLYIHDNTLKDCDVIKNLINLKFLALTYNEIKDFSFILNLEKLEKLYVPRSIKKSLLKEIRKKIPNCNIVLSSGFLNE